MVVANQRKERSLRMFMKLRSGVGRLWLRGQNNSRALKTRQTELCVASAWGSIKRRLDWMAIYTDSIY